MSKQEIINKIYHDQAGFQSVQNTYKDAHKKDKSITLKDVQDWFNKNVNRKTQLKGYNSYIANNKQQEYQIDLFFVQDLENQTDKIGMAAIDIFTKEAVVIPIKSKQIPDVLAGVMECCIKLGGYPEMIYSDEEPSLTSNEIINYLEKEKHVKMIATRSHAAYVERFIRTFKQMLYKRIEASKSDNPQWVDFIYQIMLTYNNKMVHRSHNMTPHDASLDKNSLNVKLKLEMNRKNNRKYPDINIGDKVKIYRKKKQFAKERVSVWSDGIYSINKIEETMGQQFYYVDGLHKAFLRHEVLKT